MKKTPGKNDSSDVSLVFMEPCSLHSTLRFRGLHKGVPDKPASQILSHQQDDSSVNANHIGIIPVLEGIEGVYEPVLGPIRGIAASDGIQNTHCGCRQEGQRPPGCARNNGAINWTHGGRAAPSDIPVLGVRSGNSPQVLAIIGVLLA